MSSSSAIIKQHCCPLMCHWMHACLMQVSDKLVGLLPPMQCNAAVRPALQMSRAAFCPRGLTGLPNWTLTCAELLALTCPAPAYGKEAAFCCTLP